MSNDIVIGQNNNNIQYPQDQHANEPHAQGARVMGNYPKTVTGNMPAQENNDCAVSSQLRELPPANDAAPAADEPAAFQSVAAYHTDGSLNLPPFRRVLEELVHHAQSLVPPGKGWSRTFAKAGVKALEGLEKSLKSERSVRLSTADRSNDVYASLKSAANKFNMAARCSPNNAEPLQSLSELLTQMARVEFHQRNVGRYDRKADEAADRVLKRMPHFDDVLNQDVTDTYTANLSGGVSFGFAVGTDAAGGTMKTNATLGHTRLKMAIHDFDGDNIMVDGVQNTMKLSADFIAGMGVVAGVGGGVKGTEMRAKVVETPKLRDAFRKHIQFERDGYSGASADKVNYKPVRGHGLSAGMHATGHNSIAAVRRAGIAVRAGVSGVDASPAEYQARLDRKRRTNVSTTTPTAKLANAVRRTTEIFQEKVGRTAMPLRGDRHLTSEKLQKGADAGVVAEIAAADSFGPGLQEALQAAYGDLPVRMKPHGFDNSVLIGDWNDVRISLSGSAEFAGHKLDAPFGKLTSSVGGKLELASRNLPAQLYMAPHNFVDPTLVGCNAQATLDKLRESTEFKSYLAYADSLSHQTNRLETLEQDIDFFEKQGNRLLTAAAMADSKQGATKVGRGVANEASAQLADRFFPGLDCSEARQKAMHEPEKFLARCWNALSLGLQQVRPGDAGMAAGLDRLKQRVENPNLMMSADLLHSNSILPATGELFRDRFVANINGSLSVPMAFSAVGTSVKAGVTFTVDKVHGHPNPVRNGKFIQVDIDISGSPLVNVPADWIASLVHGLEHHPDLRHNLGGLEIGASIPDMATIKLGPGVDKVDSAGTHQPQFHQLPFDGGLSFTGGNRYTYMFHMPDKVEKAAVPNSPAGGTAADVQDEVELEESNQPAAQDAAPGNSDARSPKRRMKLMFVQIASTAAVDAKVGVGANVATAVGGNAHVGLSMNNSETKSNATVLYPEPSIQLLQYGTFKSQISRLGLMNRQGQLTLGDIAPKTVGGNAADTKELAGIVAQKYFNNDCLLGVVEQFNEIRANVATNGGPSATAPDNFSVLAREEFNSGVLLNYINDSDAATVNDLQMAIRNAKEATRGMTDRQKLSYFTDGKSADGALITREYVRGMNAFNSMKFNAYFQQGKEVRAPFLVHEFNPQMALPLKPGNANAGIGRRYEVRSGGGKRTIPGNAKASGTNATDPHAVNIAILDAITVDKLLPDRFDARAMASSGSITDRPVAFYEPQLDSDSEPESQPESQSVFHSVIES